MRYRFFGMFVIAALAAALVACDSTKPMSSPDKLFTLGHGSDHEQLVAVMQPTEGNSVHGTVTFTQMRRGVRIMADIEGLDPNGRHGFHIHEYGDARAADGTSAGGHYNPEGHDHDLPGSTRRHAGDLGNLTADENGGAHFELTVYNLTLDGHHNPILGRGVIIHAQPDDGGQPTGNAGARIAIGVIGVAKP